MFNHWIGVLEAKEESELLPVTPKNHIDENTKANELIENFKSSTHTPKVLERNLRNSEEKFSHQYLEMYGEAMDKLLWY